VIETKTTDATKKDLTLGERLEELFRGNLVSLQVTEARIVLFAWLIADRLIGGSRLRRQGLTRAGLGGDRFFGFGSHAECLHRDRDRYNEKATSPPIGVTGGLVAMIRHQPSRSRS